MLESIRKRRNSVLILIAFAAIIIVFIFWGVGPNGGGDGTDPSIIATVDGESIPVREYANLYKREVEYYKNTFKEQFTDEMAQKLNLRQKALDILINRTLAIKEAKAQGIKVTDAEVQEAIKAIPVFSKDGAFDKELYFKVLSSNRLNPAEFEKSVEADLITAKIRETIVKGITVTEAEAKEKYLKENRRVDLGYIAVDAMKMKAAVAATDEEAREFLKKNGSEFMVPAKVKAFYAYASYADLSKRVKLTDAEIKEYYDKNQKQFEAPVSVKARHILLRPDPNAADAAKAKAEAKKKIEDLLKKAKAGANFAALAKANSQDPGSARQGGDLGWFQKGIMIKSFEDVAFNLKKGEISDVIETEFGYHIILVEDKKDTGVMPVKEAEPAIRQALTEQKSQETARGVVSSLEQRLNEAKSVDELKKAAASEKDVKYSVTDFFAEDDMNAELVRNELLRGAVFTLNPGAAKAVETEEGVYIIKLLERKDAHVPAFEEVASDVKEILIEEKAGAAAAKKAQELLEKAKKGEDLAALARSEKLKYDSTGYFSRTDGFMPRTGVFVGDKDGLFNLTEAAPYYSEAVPHNGKYFVFKLSGVKDADEMGFVIKKDELTSRLVAEKQDEALNKWLKGLREKSEIKVNEQLL